MEMGVSDKEQGIILLVFYLNRCDVRTDVSGEIYVEMEGGGGGGMGGTNGPIDVDYGKTLTLHVNARFGAQVTPHDLRFEPSLPEGFEIKEEKVRLRPLDSDGIREGEENGKVSTDEGNVGTVMSGYIVLNHISGHGRYKLLARVVHGELGVEMATLEPYLGIDINVMRPDIELQGVDVVGAELNAMLGDEQRPLHVIGGKKIEVVSRLAYRSEEKSAFKTALALVWRGLAPTLRPLEFHTDAEAEAQSQWKHVALRSGKVIPVRHIIDTANLKPGIYTPFIIYRLESGGEDKGLYLGCELVIGREGTLHVDGVEVRINDEVSQGSIVPGDMIRMTAKYMYIGSTKEIVGVIADESLKPLALSDPYPLREGVNVGGGVWWGEMDITLRAPDKAFNGQKSVVLALVLAHDGMDLEVALQQSAVVVEHLEVRSPGDIGFFGVYSPRMVVYGDRVNLRVVAENVSGQVKALVEVIIKPEDSSAQSVLKREVDLETGVNVLDFEARLECRGSIVPVDVHATLSVHGADVVYKARASPCFFLVPPQELRIKLGPYPYPKAPKRLLRALRASGIPVKKVLSGLDLSEEPAAIALESGVGVVVTRTGRALITAKKQVRIEDLFKAFVVVDSAGLKALYRNIAETLGGSSDYADGAGGIQGLSIAHLSKFKTEAVAELYTYLRTGKVQREWSTAPFLRSLNNFLASLSHGTGEDIWPMAEAVLEELSRILEDVAHAPMPGEDSSMCGVIAALAYMAERRFSQPKGITHRGMIMAAINNDLITYLCYIASKAAKKAPSFSTVREAIMDEWRHVLSTIALCAVLYRNHMSNHTQTRLLRVIRKEGYTKFKVNPPVELGQDRLGTLAIRTQGQRAVYIRPVPSHLGGERMEGVGPALALKGGWYVAGLIPEQKGLYIMQWDRNYWLIPPPHLNVQVSYGYAYLNPKSAGTVPLPSWVHTIAGEVLSSQERHLQKGSEGRHKGERGRDKVYAHTQIPCLESAMRIIGAYLKGDYDTLRRREARILSSALDSDGNLLIGALAKGLQCDTQGLYTSLHNSGLFVFRKTTRSEGLLLKKQITDHTVHPAEDDEIYHRFLQGKINIPPKYPFASAEQRAPVFNAMVKALLGALPRSISISKEMLRALSTQREGKGRPSTAGSWTSITAIMDNIPEPKVTKEHRSIRRLRSELQGKVKGGVRLMGLSMNFTRPLDILAQIYLMDPEDFATAQSKGEFQEAFHTMGALRLEALFRGLKAYMIGVAGVRAVELRQHAISHIAALLALCGLYEHCARAVVSLLEGAEGHRATMAARYVGSSGDINLLRYLYERYFLAEVGARNNISTAIEILEREMDRVGK